MGMGHISKCHEKSQNRSICKWFTDPERPFTGLSRHVPHLTKGAVEVFYLRAFLGVFVRLGESRRPHPAGDFPPAKF